MKLFLPGGAGLVGLNLIATLQQHHPDWQLIAVDKKAEAGRINYVLARGLGQAFMSKEASAEAVRAVLARWIAGAEG